MSVLDVGDGLDSSLDGRSVRWTTRQVNERLRIRLGDVSCAEGMGTATRRLIAASNE